MDIGKSNLIYKYPIFCFIFIINIEYFRTLIFGKDLSTADRKDR